MGVSDDVEAEAPAQVLALILSADGSVSERALGLLDELGAFDLLGVSRKRFIELARDCSCRIDPGLCERSWLSAVDNAASALATSGGSKPCSMPYASRTIASWSAAWLPRRWRTTGW